MEKTRPSLDEFIQTHPSLMAQARKYAKETVQDYENHEDAVASCITDFMEGARVALASNNQIS